MFDKKEWYLKHPTYNKEYHERHKTPISEKTCVSCGKKFLGFSHQRYCIECKPHYPVEKRKITCLWCKCEFETNIRGLTQPKWCSECRGKIPVLHKAIFERIETLYQYNKRKRENELARFEKLGCKYRFSGAHAHFNAYYFGENA